MNIERLAQNSVPVGGIGPEVQQLSTMTTGKKVQDALIDMMKQNGASVPGNVSGFARDFAKKDAQGVRVLSDPKILEGVKVGAALASEAADPSWVSRSADQSHDIQHWVEVAQRTGLIKPMSDHYRGLVEVGVWYLDAMSQGYVSQRSGTRSGSDQQAAGLGIMDAKAGKLDPSHNKTAVPILASIEGFKNWSQQDVERLAGLLASTGRNVGVELFAGPSFRQGAAQARALIGAPMTFLNDAKEARAFGDALIVLKLADRSRGQAASAVARGQDLAGDRLFNGETVIKYRAAQKG